MSNGVSETKWVDSFKRMIMDRLNVPFVNAIGNHDITRLTDNEKVVLEPDEYRRRFGPTYYSFRVGSVLHIVLDTVTEGRSITGPQKTFLDAQIARANEDAGIRNVMFWSHHLLWTQIDSRYRWLKGDPE